MTDWPLQPGDLVWDSNYNSPLLIVSATNVEIDDDGDAVQWCTFIAHNGVRKGMPFWRLYSRLNKVLARCEG